MALEVAFQLVEFDAGNIRCVTFRQPSSCGDGARTVIDLYLTEAVGNTGSFEHRLGLLVSSGQLASDDKATLKAALDAGNAAAHRGHTPNEDDLNSVMDIVEHLLHRFVLKQSAASLQKNTPPRPTK
ncbi:DUF4145 domain-containing protein [Pseudomonas protegens]|uniref:DUF4145 domain-containing protein n=1 Tax=Pseudomonas protegens TaxID=380021 RepID=UPI002A37250A|nr:DUF4145 domain-containing protein [Pseudomonas protegens]MDX9684331.1 DUF4145 domain-containing protein [Pseudomonas protegens]